MRNLNFLVLPFFVLALASSACAQEQGLDYAPWGRVLKKFVTEAGRAGHTYLQPKPHPPNPMLGATSPPQSPGPPADFPTADQLAPAFSNIPKPPAKRP